MQARNQTRDKNNAPLANQLHRKGSIHHRSRMATCLRSHKNIPTHDTPRPRRQGLRHRRCRSLHLSVLEADPHWKWSQLHQRGAHQHHIVHTRQLKTTKTKKNENDTSLSLVLLLVGVSTALKAVLISCVHVNTRSVWAAR